MSPSVVALPTCESLTEYVRTTLCERDRLDPLQTPFSGAVLRRGGRACGILFHVEGPRLLKNSAIWAGDEHRILFYDSNGVRYHEAKLSEAPEVATVRPCRAESE